MRFPLSAGTLVFWITLYQSLDTRIKKNTFFGVLNRFLLWTNDFKCFYKKISCKIWGWIIIGPIFYSKIYSILELYILIFFNDLKSKNALNWIKIRFQKYFNTTPCFWPYNVKNHFFPYKTIIYNGFIREKVVFYIIWSKTGGGVKIFLESYFYPI